MTRDMDLIRQILLDLEALDQRPGGVSHLIGENFDIEGHDADAIEYHLDLIEEAGLIERIDTRPARGIAFRRLSWAGHDFLDATRDKTVWEKTKQTGKQAGGFSFDLAIGIAKEIIKQNAAKLLGGAIGL